MDTAHEDSSKIRVRLLAICCGGVVVLFVFLYPFFSPLFLKKDRQLRVVFFDVGQGDAIFIESPTGTQILIDAGRDRSILRHLSQEMGFFDRSLDMVVMTHEDTDHAGGMGEVFYRYDVATFLRTENQGEGFVADAVDVFPQKEDASVIYARKDMTFDVGQGVALSVLFPDRDPTMLESNTSSIIMRLTYGTHSFLFTGDAPSAIEEYLVSSGVLLTSTVLKLGHHGSRTSTSPIFLSAVDPEYAVVSAGKDNPYGHPHKEVLDVLHVHDVEVLSTIDEGSIIFETDGTSLERKKYSLLSGL